MIKWREYTTQTFFCKEKVNGKEVRILQLREKVLPSDIFLDGGRPDLLHRINKLIDKNAKN